jgi:addiction module HigA family antidote
MMRKPPHPGFGIRDLIEDAGVGVTDGARKLGVKRQALNNLVNGKASISSEMAIRLERYLEGRQSSGFGFRQLMSWRRRGSVRRRSRMV